MSARFRPAWLESHRVDVSTLRHQDVVGIGHVLREVGSLVARLRDPERATAIGVEPPRGILFWGEPGLGKTLVARYLAASLGPDVPFYEVSADELTPDRIRGTLRYLAATHPRSVLYLDEIDTFGMGRDYTMYHDADTRQLLTACLSALDGLVSTSGPVVIASSNSGPQRLDAALVRAGRFGFKVRFEAPATPPDRSAGLLGESLKVMTIGEQDGPFERGQDGRATGIGQPGLEAHDVVPVALDRGCFRAVHQQVVEERLVDFA